MRQSPLSPESKPEEGLGRGDVPLGAQQEVDGFSPFVDGTVEIGPASFDFDVGLVDAPGPSSWPSEAVPAFLEFGRIALNPTHDRRVRQGESTFGHHLHEITKAEFVAQIPAHAEDDYFAIEMAALEEFVHVEHSSALSFEQSAGKLCGVNPVRTRAGRGKGKRARWFGGSNVCRSLPEPRVRLWRPHISAGSHGSIRQQYRRSVRPVVQSS